MRSALFFFVLSVAAQACSTRTEPLEPEASADYLAPASNTLQPFDLLAGEMPSPLAEAQALQIAGDTFDLDTMRALYDFGKAHADDPRPWLLLARDAMATDTQSFAVRYYRMAIAANSDAAFQDGVLDDLLEIEETASGTELEEAQQLVAATYPRALNPSVKWKADAALLERQLGEREP